MVHQQVPSDQQTQRLGFVVGQVQSPGRFRCNACSHFAVIVVVAFSQVMHQQRQVQQSLVPQIAIGRPHRPRVVQETGGALHRPNTVLVDRVLVVVVELHQAAGVLHGRDKLLEHPQFVQAPQHVGQPARLAEQRQEPVDRVRRNLGRAGPATGPLRMASHVRWSIRLPYRLARSINRSTDARLLVTSASPLRVALMCTGPTRKSRSTRWLNSGASAAVEPGGYLHAGDEVGRHVPDVARVLEEIPHEPLDRQHARQLLVAVCLGQPHLFVPRQEILGLAGMEVHFIAESQQEFVGLHQLAGDLRTTSAPIWSRLCSSRSPYRMKPIHRTLCTSRSPPRERLMFGSSR